MIITKKRIIYPLSMFTLILVGFTFALVGISMVTIPDDPADVSNYIVGTPVLCIGLVVMVWGTYLQVAKIPGGIRLPGLTSEFDFIDIESVDIGRSYTWWGMPTYEYVVTVSSEEEPFTLVSLTNYPYTVSKKKRQRALEVLRDWASIADPGVTERHVD